MMMMMMVVVVVVGGGGGGGDDDGDDDDGGGGGGGGDDDDGDDDGGGGDDDGDPVYCRSRPLCTSWPCWHWTVRTAGGHRRTAPRRIWPNYVTEFLKSHSAMLLDYFAIHIDEVKRW